MAQINLNTDECYDAINKLKNDAQDIYAEINKLTSVSSEIREAWQGNSSEILAEAVDNLIADLRSSAEQLETATTNMRQYIDGVVEAERQARLIASEGVVSVGNGYACPPPDNIKSEDSAEYIAGNAAAFAKKHMSSFFNSFND